MKTFYQFLTEQDAPKPGRPFPFPQQQQMPTQEQPKPNNKIVFDAFRNMGDATEKGFKAISDFLKNHPRRPELDNTGTTGKLANLFYRINNDIKESEALLRPLFEIQ